MEPGTAITITPAARDAAMAERCLSCEGRRNALCSAVPKDVFHSLARHGRTRQLARGETLMWDDATADIVANVRSGLLQLATGREDGQEQILGLAFAGDFVGQPYERKSGQRVVALTETSVCVFPRNDFAALLDGEPALARELLVRTFADLARARDWMQLISRKSAEERVASLLWEFFSRANRRADAPVPLPLSRQQIADVLGLTIETVSRKMRGFDRDGLIGLPDLRSFVVHRPDELERLAA